MIITIDTSKDTPQDIAKLILLLKQFTNESASHPQTNDSYSNIQPTITQSSYAQPTQQVQDGFASMFGDMSVVTNTQSVPLTSTAAQAQPTTTTQQQTPAPKKTSYTFELY